MIDTRGAKDDRPIMPAANQAANLSAHDRPQCVPPSPSVCVGPKPSQAMPRRQLGKIPATVPQQPTESLLAPDSATILVGSQAGPIDQPVAQALVVPFGVVQAAVTLPHNTDELCRRLDTYGG